MDSNIAIQQIKVTSVEEKKSKGGAQYLAVGTDKDKFSCWDAGLFGYLTAAKNSGEEIKVKFTANGVFRNILGIEGVETPQVRSNARFGAKTGAIKEAMDRKEAGITKMVDRKEASMTRLAVLRDSAMFSVETWKQFGGEKEVDMLKAAHAYWKKYFEEIYG